MNLIAVSKTASAPLVTIVITAYNGRRYIDRAVRSALTQTYPAIEVICVDDASQDGTADHVEEVYGHRVVVIRNRVNLGPSGARNRAIENATGDWIMQLDGDDWIAPDRVELLLNIATGMRADIVSDDQLVVIDDRELPVSSRFIDNGVFRHQPRVLDIDEFVYRDLGSLKPMIRRDFLLLSGIRYPESIRFGEDFLFLYELMRADARFVISSEALYFLRRGNTGSLTTQRDALFANLLTVNDTLRCAAVDRREHWIADAFDVRSRRLASLQRAERAILKIRAGKMVNLSEFFSVMTKVIHSLAANIRLAALLLCRLSQVRRRMHAVDRETLNDCPDRQSLHRVRLEKDCSESC